MRKDLIDDYIGACKDDLADVMSDYWRGDRLWRAMTAEERGVAVGALNAPASGPVPLPKGDD